MPRHARTIGAVAALLALTACSEDLDPLDRVATPQPASVSSAGGADVISEADFLALSPDAVLRVDVAGDGLVDLAGGRWSADEGCSGEAYTSPEEIEGTELDPLFQSRRFEPRCSWELPDGRYDVVAGFAETYRDGAGYRVFGIEAEGREVATIDAGGDAGFRRPHLVRFSTEVRDGRLDVQAVEDENRPMLALLMAVPRAGAAAPPATTAEPDEPVTTRPAAPGELLVGPGQPYATLQDALEEAGPGATVRLVGGGPHEGPARTRQGGAPGRPLVITADEGAWLECGSPDDDEVARCLEVQHPHLRIEDFEVRGGSSTLYMVGAEAGSYVSDVVVTRSRFVGASGTGECIRVKYQASDIEISHNEIEDCGLDVCCEDSKNGEGVYVGTAPEQLEDKNPSPEPDRTHDVWIHHNRIRSWNECVDIKEAAYDVLVEHNDCSGQSDDDSGAFGSRGGRVGEGNTIRFNVVEGALGACVRFGGDEEPDGTGNDFYGNVCRDIEGELGVKLMALPQGVICGNTFEGDRPSDGLTREGDDDEGSEEPDPTAPCPAGTPTSEEPPGAGRR